MSDLTSLLGLSSLVRSSGSDERTEHIIVQRPLSRILAFTGRSIDDVVNDRIAKGEVWGYYKLYRAILRHEEVASLEHQWNPLGMTV